MDHTFAGFDQPILTTVATTSASHPPSCHSLLNKVSAGSNTQLQLSGFMSAGIKCEEIPADIFARAAAAAAAHLIHEKAIKLPEPNYFNSSILCEPRSGRAPVPSCVPKFDAGDFVASSNSFGFLASSSDYIPSLRSLARPQEGIIEDSFLSQEEVDGFNLADHTVLSSSSLSGNRLHATEVFRATTGLRASTPTLLQSSADGMPAASRTRATSSPPDVSDASASISDSANSPSKQDSRVHSTEDSDGGPKIENLNSKRRKSQQKRVVSVPIRGESKQKGEAPPSDLWAWRKYGQKPIKGSPYPRGYYRCSSSKGCPARKQVERSRSDPNMLLISYSSDHNHPWPVSQASSSVATNCSSPGGNKQVQEEAAGAGEASGNLFSSIINSPNVVDRQVVSPFDSIREEESFRLKRDVDLCLSRISTEDQDVFDDLGELPELSAILSKGFLEETSNNEVFSNSIYTCDSYSISSWASTMLPTK